MAKVAASDVQKNFGAWHDEAYERPVEITRYGRTTAYLVSASHYRDMLASYRKAMPTADLDQATLGLIGQAKVDGERAYTLDDLPDED